jgi:hypothetical protein
MVYSEDEIVDLAGDDDAHIPDTAQDIKVRHHRAKNQGQGQPTATGNESDSEEDG